MNPQAARGALLLVGAMACFSLSDVLAKRLSGTVDPIVLAWVRFVLLFATVLPLALRRPALARSQRPGLQLVRAAALVASALVFLFGLRHLPVAEATAMVFASPLFVTSLAAFALREHVPAARWVPVTLGFAGVLIVARPGSSAFGWAAAFPIVSSMAWAVAVVATRRLGASDATATTLLYSSATGAACLTLFLPGFGATPWAMHAWSLLGTAIAWSAAQWLTVAAYRAAPAAGIAPFAYTQLLWASLLGWAAFGHLPDAVSVAGMAVILASGLLAAWQARQLKA